MKAVQFDKKSLYAPDNYDTESYNLTAWQPTARARETLDSH
jgi:hypothetical protein